MFVKSLIKYFNTYCLWPCSLAISSTGSVGLCFFVVVCPGAPEGSTGSGSGFKASHKMEPRL